MTRPTVVPRDLVVEGRLDGEGDVIVLGRVEGPIAVDGLVVIEEGAFVHGDVHARSLTVRGGLVGHATATEALWVDPSGSVVGDLRARRVRIASGARFRGRTYVEGADGEAPAPLSRPPAEPRRPSAPPSTPPQPRSVAPSFVPRPRDGASWPDQPPPFPELRRIRGRARPIV